MLFVMVETPRTSFGLVLWMEDDGLELELGIGIALRKPEVWIRLSSGHQGGFVYFEDLLFKGGNGRREMRGFHLHRSHFSCTTDLQQQCVTI